MFISKHKRVLEKWTLNTKSNRKKTLNTKSNSLQLKHSFITSTTLLLLIFDLLTMFKTIFITFEKF